MTVWTHIFRSFKTSTKGKPCLDSVDKTQTEFATEVWKKLVNAFRPQTAALSIDLGDKLMKEAVYDGTKTMASIIANIRNLSNRLTALGQPPQMLTKLEDSIIRYAAKQPEDAIEKRGALGFTTRRWLLLVGC
eukprot:3800593-Rhodomonas_salina.1